MTFFLSAVGYNAKIFLTLLATTLKNLSAVGESAKICFLYLHVCINFKTKYLKNKKAFCTNSFYIHVLPAQQTVAL
jgi:hypothetical protein